MPTIYVPHLNQYKCKRGYHFHDKESDAEMCCNGYSRVNGEWMLDSELIKLQAYKLQQLERQRKVAAALHASKAAKAKRDAAKKLKENK